MTTLLQKNWYWVGFVTLIVITVLTRFYLLGSLPHGMTWDEAAIGYNGFAIWHTHRDEWVHFMPLSFMSFGDYKAPLAIYLNGFFTFVFGMNAFAVRFPFALASVAAVVGFAWLGWLVARITKLPHPKLFSLIGMTLLTFSPWHIHFSRAGFESGMATSFLIWGVSFLLAFIYSKREPFSFKPLNMSYLVLFLASGFLVASMYTYHSAKIVIPFLSLAVVGFWWPVWKKQWQQLLFIAVLSAVLLMPLVIDSVRGAGATRLSQTSIFSAPGSLTRKLTLFGQNFVTHFSPQFLILGETTTLRHGDGTWGVLLPTTAILVIVGALGLIRSFLAAKKSTPAIPYQKALLFSVAWLCIGIAPAALGADDVPHSNRALLALPGFLLLAASGWLILVDAVSKSKLNLTVKGNHGEPHSVRNALIGTTVLLHGIFFLSYWNHYLTAFAAESSSAFQDGYLEAMEIVKQYEKGMNGKPEVDKIMFSSEYGQPYIYAIFSRKTDPIYYQGGSLIKYEFTDVDMGDFQRTNTLIVGTVGDTDLPLEKADYVVYGSDGKMRFQLYYRP